MVALAEFVGFLTEICSEFFGRGAVESLLFGRDGVADAYVDLFAHLAPHFGREAERSCGPANFAQEVEPPAVAAVEIDWDNGHTGALDNLENGWLPGAVLQASAPVDGRHCSGGEEAHRVSFLELADGGSNTVDGYFAFFGVGSCHSVDGDEVGAHG